MRNLFSMLMVVLFAFGLLLSDAEAGRFGGGRSFGTYRASNSYSRAAPLQSPQRGATGNKWLGPLAGLAMGGLLAALFMQNGIGSGILSWLMIGGVCLLLWNLFMRSRAPMASQQQYKSNVVSNPFAQFSPNQAQNAAQPPVGFEENVFLREAKSQFLRLQSAYDDKNLNDIREFTTPEVSAEIQLQFQERGDASNVTEVVTLEAVLLDVAEGQQGAVASVRFSGLVKEDPSQTAESFNEVWHFQKVNSGDKWVVAGVQQQ